MHKDVWNCAWWLIWKSTGEMYWRCNKWSMGESYGIWQWVEWWGNRKSACGSAKTCKSFAHFANHKNFGDHLRQCSYIGIKLDCIHLFISDTVLQLTSVLHRILLVSPGVEGTHPKPECLNVLENVGNRKHWNVKILLNPEMKKSHQTQKWKNLINEIKC